MTTLTLSLDDLWLCRRARAISVAACAFLLRGEFLERRGFNKLDIFIDAIDGGQLKLRGDNPNVDFNGLNRMGDDGSNNGLRFDDEFVRHKILDVIGDMALVGYPMIGHLVAHRGGHALHTAFAAKVLEESEAWMLVEGGVDAAQAVPLPVSNPVQAN